MLEMWIDGGEHAWDVKSTVQTNMLCFRTSPSSTPYHGLAYWRRGIPSSYAEWTLLCGWAFISYVKNFENQTGAKWQSGCTVQYSLVHRPPNCCMFLVFFLPMSKDMLYVFFSSPCHKLGYSFKAIHVTKNPSPFCDAPTPTSLYVFGVCFPLSEDMVFCAFSTTRHSIVSIDLSWVTLSRTICLPITVFFGVCFPLSEDTVFCAFATTQHEILAIDLSWVTISSTICLENNTI
jgi:hypothetical protein